MTDLRPRPPRCARPPRCPWARRAAAPPAVSPSGRAAREAGERTLGAPFSRRCSSGEGEVASGGVPTPLSDGPASDAGRGVIVLGMHRSGTSGVTEMLHGFGLAVAAGHDRMRPQPSNPQGHWESTRLTTLNEAILFDHGGTWSAPPVLVDGWESDPPSRERRAHARRAFASTHPRAPWAWKDPRTCLTLAFWRVAIGDQAVVMVIRHPLEVAASLYVRNGLQPAVGVALWERYVRSEVAGAEGLPALVLFWDGVRADPSSASAAAARFLAGTGLVTAPLAAGAAQAAVDRVLEPVGDIDDDYADVAGARRAADLFGALRDLAGAHDLLPPCDLGHEDQSTTALLEERRQGEVALMGARVEQDALVIGAGARRAPHHAALAARRATARATRLLGGTLRKAALRDAPPEWSGEDVVFLVGQPKSGTTIVARLLGAHPDVAYWEEPALLEFAVTTRAELTRLRRRIGEAEVDTVTALRRPLAGLRPATVADAARAYRTAAAEVNAVVGSIVVEYLERSGARVLLEKSPGQI